MELMPIIMLFAGAATVLELMVFAFSGPFAPERGAERRLGAVRARHSDSSNALVEAQMRRITASRATKMDAAAMRFLPRPALLKKRLAMTGKTWTVGQYGMATLGITVVVAVLVWLQGMPIALSLLLGIMLGAGIPHFGVGFFIKRRIAQFTANSPTRSSCSCAACDRPADHRDDRVWSAQEVRRPVGVEFRSITDKMKIGRTMDVALSGDCRPARHARIPVLRHHHRDPARDRRQPCRDARQPGERAAHARPDEAEDQGDVVRDPRRRPISSARCPSSCSA